MNAKVKGITFSVITAVCIAVLTIAPAAAICGGYTHYGYVYDKDGVELTGEPVITMTNMETGVSWNNSDPEITTIPGFYQLASTAPNPPCPRGSPDSCPWHTGEVVKYEVSNQDGTQTNTTTHTMTEYEISIGILQMDIYLEEDVAEINFTKELSAGWNLISLPVEPSDNSTSAVLGGTSTITYDAAYSYNAASHSWDSELGGTMDPGKGYFVNVATAGTWNCSGTPYTQMNVSLEPGLNMVGWLNCSLSITGADDALSSLDGKYNYVARFNAAEQRFEAYNPHAPSAAGFNDFTDMTRGTGYFISARATCPPLDKICP